MTPEQPSATQLDAGKIKTLDGCAIKRRRAAPSFRAVEKHVPCYDTG